METRTVEIKIPEEFYCQLTGQVFHSPVILPNNVNAEKEFIEAWIAKHGTNPFTRQPLSVSDLELNQELKEEISTFYKDIEGLPGYEQAKEMQFKPNNDDFSLEQIRGPAEPTSDDMLAMRSAISRSIIENQRMPISAVSDTQASISFFQANNQTRFSRFIERQREIAGTRFLRNSRRQFNSRFRFTATNNTSSELQDTLSQLASYGLTARQIEENWSAPDGQPNNWRAYNKVTLVFLVTGELPEQLMLPGLGYRSLPADLRLSPVEALQEISGLGLGKTRCLMKTYSRGIRGEDLRAVDLATTTGPHDWGAVAAKILHDQFSLQEAIRHVEALNFEERISLAASSNSSLTSERRL